VRAIANPKALGFSISADVLLEVESGIILEAAREMTGYECVSYVACDVGRRISAYKSSGGIQTRSIVSLAKW